MSQGAIVREYGNEPMVKTPTALLRNPAISSHAAVLYGLIAVHLSIEHTNPNHRRLALNMGVSVPTVRRALKELVDAGWVGSDPMWMFVDSASPASTG